MRQREPRGRSPSPPQRGKGQERRGYAAERDSRRSPALPSSRGRNEPLPREQQKGESGPAVEERGQKRPATNDTAIKSAASSRARELATSGPNVEAASRVVKVVEGGEGQSARYPPRGEHNSRRDDSSAKEGRGQKDAVVTKANPTPNQGQREAGPKESRGGREQNTTGSGGRGQETPEGRREKQPPRVVTRPLSVSPPPRSRNQGQGPASDRKNGRPSPDRRRRPVSRSPSKSGSSGSNSVSPSPDTRKSIVVRGLRSGSPQVIRKGVGPKGPSPAGSGDSVDSPEPQSMKRVRGKSPEKKKRRRSRESRLAVVKASVKYGIKRWGISILLSITSASIACFLAVHFVMFYGLAMDVLCKHVLISLSLCLYRTFATFLLINSWKIFTCQPVTCICVV